MIKCTITPDNKTVAIDVPETYIGKQIEVLLYSTDELKEQTPVLSPKKTSLRGALKLTDGQYKDVQQYLNDVRNEWNRAI
jgi:hypothetical protein